MVVTRALLQGRLSSPLHAVWIASLNAPHRFLRLLISYVCHCRLSSELMSLMMSSPAGISAFPESDADLTFWKGRIEGAEVCSFAFRGSTTKLIGRTDQGTYYSDQTYAISLKFPPTYPYAAPTVRFETTCFRAFCSSSSSSSSLL